MIEVIKHGKKKFTATCANCGCEFSYELSDRNGLGGVDCPDCGHYVAHPNFNSINGSYYPPNCRKIDDTPNYIYLLAPTTSTADANADEANADKE